MTNFKISKKLVFLALFLLSVFVVFFVGRKFDPETGKRNFIITTDGINHFRKGLDVSGGTRLVYKISYAKYEQLGYNAAELVAVKKTIETIITKNLDKRISKLGVSDYVVYSKKVGEDDQIVIEIGGISDLDQAKETIGRTVELEFRMLNKTEPTADIVAAREKLANQLLGEAKKNADKVASTMGSRGSEGIFYNEFSGATIAQLPNFYVEHKSLLDTQELNTFSAIVKGTYQTSQSQDENGKTVSQDIKGFTFFRVKDRKTEPRNVVGPEDIIAGAKRFALLYEQVFEKDTNNIVKENTYQYKGTSLVYNAGAFASGQTAYKMDIYAFDQEATIGKTDEQIKAIQTASSGNVETIKADLLKGAEPTTSGVSMIYSGWLDASSIAAVITSFSNPSGDRIQVYQQGDTFFITKTYDTKKAEEAMSVTLQVNGVDQKAFEAELKTKTTYTLEDVFVQDRETWAQALDSKTRKILNGAYFSYASNGVSQVGQKVVNINFDEEGKGIFCNVTEQNIGNQMAIFVGGEIVTNATIRSKICGGGAFIEGNFSGTKKLSDGKIAGNHNEGTEFLIENLNDGTMPAPLVLMQEEKINPTLGIGALTGSLIAGAIGTVAIFIMMLLMYGPKKGLITVAVLVNFLIVLLAFMKLSDFALSLSGIAATILSIGMGVDANVLIFERIREELKAGKSMTSSIHIAIVRSRAPIKDGQVSTGLIALVLFALGINIFKGFGSMMIVNLLLILLVNVAVTEILLHLFYSKKSDYLSKSVLDKQIKDL